MNDGKTVVARLATRYTGMIPYNEKAIGGVHGDDLDLICVYLSKSSNLDNHFKKNYGIEDFYLSKSKSIHVFGSVFKLVKIIRQKKVDVLHCIGEKAGVYGFFASKICKGIKLIFQADPVELANERIGLIGSIAMKKYDLVIVSGASDKKKIINSGVEVDKVEILDTSIDHERFAGCETNREQARDLLQLPHDALVFGSVGSLDKDRMNSELIDAFAMVKKTIGNAHLVFIGQGEQDEQLKEQARQSGFGDAIHFAGRRDDIEKCLRGIDIFVCAKLKYDGLPRPVLEAMASGVPCIGPVDGGLDDLFADGTLGRNVEQFNADNVAAAMVELATAPHNKVLDVVNAASNKIENGYDHKVTISKLKRIYSSV